MRYLIDTSVLIWWLADDGRLSATASDVLGDHRNEIYVSSMAILEISIKQSIGKLRIAAEYVDYIHLAKMKPLPVTFEHARAVQDLPLHHRDPFDRVMVAQCLVEKLCFITRDAEVGRYGVEMVKA